MQSPRNTNKVQVVRQLRYLVYHTVPVPVHSNAVGRRRGEQEHANDFISRRSLYSFDCSVGMEVLRWFILVPSLSEVGSFGDGECTGTYRPTKNLLKILLRVILLRSHFCPFISTNKAGVEAESMEPRGITVPIILLLRLGIFSFTCCTTIPVFWKDWKLKIYL